MPRVSNYRRRGVFLGLIWLVTFHPAFAANEQTLAERLRPPLVAAHQGGEFGIPNSLIQFSEDLENTDADILEMDLRLTSDGRVVVFHDDLLDSKTDCTGRVETTTYAELIECRRTNGERIALFSDVLTLVNGRRIISAELKTDSVALPAVQDLIRANASNWAYLQVQANRHRYDIVHAAAPNILMMVKTDSAATLGWILAANDPSLKIVEVDRDALTDALARELHRHGKLVSLDTWRYQFTEERFSASCDRAFAEGVDIAVTNNAASCSLQRAAWGHPASSSGVAYDRQHMRGWVRDNASAWYWMKFSTLSLIGAALAAGCLRYSIRWRRRRGQPWPIQRRQKDG
ncbi:hypothetical protein BH11PSE14_BH11PSE14_17950 [soil metagenome]